LIGIDNVFNEYHHVSIASEVSVMNDIHLKKCTLALIAVLSTAVSSIAVEEGWVVWPKSGKVYRCRHDKEAEIIYDAGDAIHAAFNADGRYIFVRTQSSGVLVMNNDGSNKRRIPGSTFTPYGYRPDSDYVLRGGQDKFYKVKIATGEATLIHDDSRSFYSEIAISTDGMRMAARSGDLYKIEVGKGSSRYAGRCSASISPNGKMLTKNMSGHLTMRIYNWDGGYKTVNAKDNIQWDNQRFAVNSDSHVVYNTGSTVGVINIETGAHTFFGSVGSSGAYPDFFSGELPPVSATDIAVARHKLSIARKDMISAGRYYALSGRLLKGSNDLGALAANVCVRPWERVFSMEARDRAKSIADY
jgi:hypothetical protein